MASVNEEECEAAGVNSAEVKKIAKAIELQCRKLRGIGACMFAGSNGSIRFEDGGGKGLLILADIFGCEWDGGDGAEKIDDQGLSRGEHHSDASG